MKFPRSSGFKQALDARVDRYFEERHLARRDQFAMYVKALAILCWTVAAYIVLVFFAPNGWVAVPAALALGFGLVGIGFNIQHDGNHGGFSRHRWVNHVAGCSLDVMGASSYFWRMKHNVLHHTYTNISGKDDDIHLWPLARLSPDHRRLWFHRYQHLYLWVFYGMVHMKYLYSDSYRLVFRKFQREAVSWPRAWEMVELLAGKAAFVTVAFLLPWMFHPALEVLGFDVGISLMIGIIFSIVFQLAHMVDTVDHPGAVTILAEHEFAIHQIKTTANFAPASRFWTACLGGLNLQREHHLFPKIAHVHYPALSRIVREVCAEYGVPCYEHSTIRTALRSHYIFLREIGRA